MQARQKETVGDSKVISGIDDTLGVAMLQVSEDQIKIASFNRAFSQMVDEPNPQALLRRNINDFMPYSIAKVHDSCIVNYR